MGLLLICPQCRARIPLSSGSCPTCDAGLRDLPPEDRCYIFGEPEEVASPALPLEVIPAIAAADGVEAGEGFCEPETTDTGLSEHREVSLCEALDRILHKGAVLYGEVMLSVADIDLVYLGLQVILASVETARGFHPGQVLGQSGANLADGRGPQ